MLLPLPPFHKGGLGCCHFRHSTKGGHAAATSAIPQKGGPGCYKGVVSTMLPLPPFHMVRVVVCGGEKTRVMALVSLRFHAVLPYTISSSEYI